MHDDGMHDDGAAGDGVYGAKVPFQAFGDEVKYYVRAQNQEGMQLKPERAEYVFYEYTVGAPQSIDLPAISALTISPNPSQGRFSLTWEAQPLQQLDPVVVYDLQGKRLKAFPLTHGPRPVGDRSLGRDRGHVSGTDWGEDGENSSEAMSDSHGK